MSTPVNKAIVAYSTPSSEGKDHEYVFEAAEVPYPTIDPESDDIIIKVEAAPINPSDLGKMMAGGVWVAAMAKQETKQAGPGKLVTPLPEAVCPPFLFCLLWSIAWCFLLSFFSIVLFF